MHEAYYRDLCEGNITRPEGIRAPLLSLLLRNAAKEWVFSRRSDSSDWRQNAQVSSLVARGQLVSMQRLLRLISPNLSPNADAAQLRRLYTSRGSYQLTLELSALGFNQNT
ncbi:unnamed protein product [Gadus morhua 'NCC']